MATISLDVEVAASAQAAWDAARDYGALHARLVPGFVTATEVVQEGGVPVRLVTFGSGRTYPERIVTVDDAARRLVWSLQAPGVDHHNGALQVRPTGPASCRVTWIADILPAAAAEQFAPQMRAAIQVLKTTLERGGEEAR